MQGAIVAALSREFRSRAETAWRERLLRHYNRERDRRKQLDLAEAETDELIDLVGSVLSCAEIATFRSELDAYDAATVSALQKNQLMLDETQERYSQLLNDAHLLPDGRRVFKSEDRVRVFDENGTSVDADVIHPDLIDDTRPSWETYQPVHRRVQELLRERQRLHTYQAQLDDARQRLDSETLDRDEFDSLREELRDSMPDSVREEIGHIEGTPVHSEGSTHGRETPPSATAEKLELDPTMLPASLAPKV